LSGCVSVGPKGIERDRFDYVSAISESWKRETLLNLLKTRYQDAPIFLDIASVINQYSVEHELDVGLSAEIYNKGEPSFISPGVGAKGTYTDRPTITYSPLMGERFASSLLKPLPLPAILILIQSGYPADYVFWICAQSIQGLRNRKSIPMGAQPADPEFYELLELFKKLKDSGMVAIRSRTINSKETAVIFFKHPNSEASSKTLKRLIQLLELNTGILEFPVMPGSVPLNDKEINIFSRSLLQIMAEYASYIEVPDSDISEGRVYDPRRVYSGTPNPFPQLIRVHNGVEKPEQTYVAVSYRGSWFWIDDRDLHSKSMFYFLMILFSFTERGTAEQAAPVITVPTN